MDLWPVKYKLRISLKSKGSPKCPTRRQRFAQGKNIFKTQREILYAVYYSHVKQRIFHNTTIEMKSAFLGVSV